MISFSKPLIRSSAPQPRWTAPASFYGASIFRKFQRLHPAIYGIFIYSLLCCMMASSNGIANAQSNANNPTGCISSFDAGVDYFPVKAQVSPNASFTLSYTKSTKTIVDSISGQTIVLYQCGAPVPQVSAGTKLIQIPVNKVALGDTTSVTFIEVLGVRNSIALTSSIEYISSPCIQQEEANSVLAGTALPINNINMTTASSEINQIQQQSQLYLDYLDPLESNITDAVSFPATAETLAYNRAQWIQFVAAFYNLESKATASVNSINSYYSCINKAALFQQAKTSLSPLVAWVSYSAPASWNNNTASWTISNAKYKSDYTLAAGGKFLNSSTTTFSDTNSFLNSLSSVDVLIDETLGAVTTTDIYKNFGLSSTSTNYKFVKNQQIWQANKYNNANGGDPWFESAVLFTHLVLADLTLIIQPDVFAKYSVNGNGYNTTFFRNIYKTSSQITLTSAMCSAADNTTLQIPSIDCSQLTTSSSGAASTVFGHGGGWTVAGSLMIGFVALIMNV